MSSKSIPVDIDNTPYGWGVFAQQGFSADETVGRVKGRVVEDESYDSDYCMELTDAAVLDPAPPFRFLNHACEPNCELVWTDEEEDAPPQMFVVALSDIAAGEQLTIDYNWPVECAIPCRCGSRECRGWIADPEELDLSPSYSQWNQA